MNPTEINRIEKPLTIKLVIHETSFVRDHVVGIKSAFLFYIVCFFRQSYRSVCRADYLTMGHGFVTSSSVGFCRDLPAIDSQWMGSDVLLIDPAASECIRDNVFLLDMGKWSWHVAPWNGIRTARCSSYSNGTVYAFNLAGDGLAAEVVCSYITFPLYALVSQMGSTMKRSIFDEQTSKALMQWHMKAVQKKNETKLGDSPVHSPTKARLRLGKGGSIEDAANITASVDVSGREQQQHNQGYHEHDLLTGP
ncbi:hypothetical protein SAY87_021877 [Trapa incisa]|uniref:Uncharacterized protein n=1 Tax=Trapa incisa TaxID=236973 RepID=A0AAN7PSJ7_9MYRT|nr:hypothetical protein SAY87_021877 [Trapa incisa]